MRRTETKVEEEIQLQECKELVKEGTWEGHLQPEVYFLSDQSE